MLNIKKFVVLFLVAVVVCAGVGAGSKIAKNNHKNNQIVKIKDKYGFKVLDIKQGKYDSTVVSMVVDNDEDKDGIVYTVNMFDKKDKMGIESNGKYKKGDIVLISYHEDQIVKVEKNKLKITNKIDGQKVLN